MICPTTLTEGVSPHELLDGVAAASVAVGVASQRLRLRAGPASLPGVWSHELRPGDLPAFTSSLSHAVCSPGRGGPVSQMQGLHVRTITQHGNWHPYP